ncbi:MAG: LysE family translocator [Verrucomicrobiales bacterium]|nr:LysE family translocator [Verrucomicrobiales bacterium]
MIEPSAMLIPWATGFLAGYLACIPVGPVNVTIINEGARRGFRHAFFVGLGAVVMEMIYSGIAFAGFAQLFTSALMRAIMELVSFVVVTAMGVKYLMTREMPAAPHALQLVEQRLHPHTAFMTGFVRVLGNPATLLFWIAFAAASVAHEWVDQEWPSKASAIVGIGLGALTWFSKLGYAVSLGHGKFSSKALLRTAHVSGILLIAAGLFMGGRLVVALAKHRQQQAEKRKVAHEQPQVQFEAEPAPVAASDEASPDKPSPSPSP